MWILKSLLIDLTKGRKNMKEKQSYKGLLKAGI